MNDRDRNKNNIIIVMCQFNSFNYSRKKKLHNSINLINFFLISKLDG